MESAFAWIGYVAEWLGAFIPRIKIIRSTHAGVRFRHGKYARAMGPGIHVYWPIVTEVDVIPVARQTQNLPSQSLMTKDGQQVVVSGIVVYSIKDVVAAISNNWDVTETISDITMTAIGEIVTTHTLDEMRGELAGKVQKALTKVTRKKLAPFGVRVFRTALTDFSTCIVLKTLGDGQTPMLVK